MGPSPLHSNVTRRAEDSLPRISTLRPPFPVCRMKTQGYHVIMEELQGPLLPRPGNAELRHFAGSDDLDEAFPQEEPPPPCVERLLQEWRDSEMSKRGQSDWEAERELAKAQAESGFVDWLTTREAESEAAAAHGPPSHSVKAASATTRVARLCGEALAMVAVGEPGVWRDRHKSMGMPSGSGRRPPQPFHPPPIGGNAVLQIADKDRCGSPNDHRRDSVSVLPPPGAELCLAVTCACFDRLVAVSGPLTPLFSLVRDCLMPRLYAQGARSLVGDWGGLAARVKHYLGQTPYFGSDAALRREGQALSGELRRAKDHMRVWAWSIWKNVLRGTRRQQVFIQRVEIMVSSRTRKLALRQALMRWVAYTDVRRAGQELRLIHEQLGKMVPDGTTMLERLNKITEELQRRDEALKLVEMQLAKSAAKQDKLAADARRAEARANKHARAAEEALQRHCETCSELHQTRNECRELRARMAEMEAELSAEREVCDHWRKVSGAMLAHISGQGPVHDIHLRRRLRAQRRAKNRKKRASGAGIQRVSQHSVRSPTEEEDSSSDDSVASCPADVVDPTERHAAILRDWGNRVLEEHARTETWRPEGEATRPNLSTFTLETRDCILYARLLHAFSVLPSSVLRPHPPPESDASPRSRGRQAGAVVRNHAAAREAAGKGGPAPASCGHIFGDLPTMPYVTRAGVILEYAAQLLGTRAPVTPADIADGLRSANVAFVSTLYLACASPLNHATEAQLVRRVLRPAPPVSELEEEDLEASLSTPQGMFDSFWKAADRTRSWRAHSRLVCSAMVETLQPGNRGQAAPGQGGLTLAVPQLRPIAPRLRALLVKRTGDIAAGEEAEFERCQPTLVVVEQHAKAIQRVFRHYATGAGLGGSQLLAILDWVGFCTDCGLVPRVCSAEEAEKIFLFSNQVVEEPADTSALNREHSLSLREFVEALIRVADLLDRDPLNMPPLAPKSTAIGYLHRSARSFISNRDKSFSLQPGQPSSLQLTPHPPEAGRTPPSAPSGPSAAPSAVGGSWGAEGTPTAEHMNAFPDVDSPSMGLGTMSLSTLLSMLMVKYVIPHASQSELDALKKQIAGDDVQRVLRRYEAPLKAVFFFYVKGHIETGAALDLQDFQRLMKDCNFISADFTHQTVTTIFVSCTNSGGRDDGRMPLHCFFDTLAYVALYKQPSPFTPLFKRLDYFLSRQFFSSLRSKVSTLAHHMKLLNAAALDGMRALTTAQTAVRRQVAIATVAKFGAQSVASGGTNDRTSRSPLGGTLSRSGSTSSMRPSAR
eukprot:Hpha_TRINITY_DN16482_c0_g5::TRINITY_DN16482_c0_g5_i1::g.163380::m.163380